MGPAGRLGPYWGVVFISPPTPQVPQFPGLVKTGTVPEVVSVVVGP